MSFSPRAVTSSMARGDGQNQGDLTDQLNSALCLFEDFAAWADFHFMARLGRE